MELKTELEVSEAKTKVIEELEQSVHEDNQPVIHGIPRTVIEETKIKVESRQIQDKPSDEANVKVEPSQVQVFSLLDPTAPAWNPLRQTTDNVNQTPIARELNKPKADIQKFDGNPMNYKRFLRQFNSRIVSNTESYEERLNYLLQFYNW